jgi:purine nucleosidase
MIYDKYDFKLHSNKIIRVITNTDAKNEADDQFAIAHTLLSPKFDNKGIIAAHFGNRRNDRSMEESYEEVVKVLNYMNMGDKVPALKGSPVALPDEKTPVPSAGAELIIKEAMSDDDRPLFVTFLGPLTDIASAYLMEPAIADKLTVIWIGGGKYPEGGREYNLESDVSAANVVFNSNLQVWQVPQNVYRMIMITLPELQYKVKPHGDIGKYLFDQIAEYLGNRDERIHWGSGECWCLGDSPAVGLMLYEHTFSYDMIPAPRFAKDFTYIHGTNNRPIRVYNHVDSRMILEDFYAKLALFAMDEK